jgi:hypothetical protein
VPDSTGLIPEPRRQGAVGSQKNRVLRQKLARRRRFARSAIANHSRAIAQGDDAIGTAAGRTERGSYAAGETGAGMEDAEIGGDIGLEVHFPDEVTCAFWLP